MLHIRMVCIHGLAPLAFIEDGPPDNFRRNLRFGNTGGDGCCFPYFAPWAPGPGGPPDKRMLTAGMPSFEEYRKSHD